MRGANGRRGARMAGGSGCAQHSPEAEEGRTDAREQALCVSAVQTLAGMTAARFCAGQAVGVWWWRPASLPCPCRADLVPLLLFGKVFREQMQKLWLCP